jgi:hypothetical protein
MAATTIKQTEAVPSDYPDPAWPLSSAAAALPIPMIWQRIEAYVAYRWTAREVEWIVEGPGEWRPPLAPAEITDVEVWSSADEWEAATPRASPLGGYYLPATGPYRFTATVGGGSPAPEVPEIVIEAFRRLAEYFAARTGKAGARSESVAAGSVNISTTRSASWMAQAIENSGAGDLLRSLRRV